MAKSNEEMAQFLPEEKAPRKVAEEGLLQKQEVLTSLRENAYIPGISIATITDGKLSWSSAQGVADMSSGALVDESTIFEAGSLSKPVFAYLVLKLVEKNPLFQDFLTQPLPEIEYGRFKSEDKEKVSSLTPQKILSHQTGLPNWEPGNNQLEFAFKPGDEYRYSGEGYHYLQKVIEHKSGKSLEKLAEKYIFTPLEMKNSHFERAAFKPGTKFASRHNEMMQPQPYIDEITAAGSLQTTARDYAKFIEALLKEQVLREQAMKELVSMEKDKTPKKNDIPQKTLQSVGWGLGWGLEKTEKGLLAFHWGDIPGIKAFVAINPTEPSSAIVYFANSENGLSIAKKIVTPTVGLTSGLDYLCGKYDYTQYDKPGYKERHEGLIAESNGDYKTAIIKFKQALEQDPESEKQLTKHLEWLNNLDHPIEVKKEKLQEYVGKYGPQEITIEGESLGLKLFGKNYKLIPVAENIFSPENNLNFRLEFDKELEQVTYHYLTLDSRPEIEKRENVVQANINPTALQTMHPNPQIQSEEQSSTTTVYKETLKEIKSNSPTDEVNQDNSDYKL